jgi:hypothetical protein
MHTTNLKVLERHLLRLNNAREKSVWTVVVVLMVAVLGDCKAVLSVVWNVTGLLCMPRCYNM